MEAIEHQVKKFYPNAQSGAEITETYLEFLQNEYKADLTKMLFATSLCCDDINISTDFRKVLTRPFTMGGLGGLPYAGFTGMVAYAHHVPDHGELLFFTGRILVSPMMGCWVRCADQGSSILRTAAEP